MKYIPIIIFTLSAQLLIAQEQLGLRLENYSGINSVLLNPAGNLTNPLQWDVNIAAAAFFVENNYAFIENTNTFDLLSNASEREFYAVPDPETQVPANAYIIDFFDDSRKRFGISQIDIMGPSFVFRIGEQHSIGLFTRARMMASTQGLPNELSYYPYNSRAFLENFQLGPLGMAAMNWSELGLNYAFKTPTNSGAFGIGINARLLTGYEAAFFQHTGTVQFAKNTQNSAIVQGVFAEFGYTSSNLVANSNEVELQKNGKGFAFDIGLLNIIGGEADDYTFKIGLSLLDVGFINFNKNASSHIVQTDSTKLLGGNAYNQFIGLEELDGIAQLFSTQALDDPNASLNGDEFKIWLPTAFSLQVDYAFTENIFLNSTLVQRLPVSEIAVERGNLFSLSPRFEHRWFSASLPLVLYNWQDFRVGFAARLAFLTIGSDNLGSFLGKKDYSGTDFYIALKINAFQSGLSTGGQKLGKGKRGKKVRCYDF